MAYLRVPVADRSVPCARVMRQILDIIDRSVQRKEPVFVHCWAGLGRTGTVVGCYLMRHSLATAGDVMQKIRELRQRTGVPGPSPHTSGQIKLVVGWRPEA